MLGFAPHFYSAIYLLSHLHPCILPIIGADITHPPNTLQMYCIVYCQFIFILLFMNGLNDC